MTEVPFPQEISGGQLRGPAGSPERVRRNVGPGRAKAGLHNDKFVVILTLYQIPPLIFGAAEGER
jgi:hypothetical protein